VPDKVCYKNISDERGLMIRRLENLDMVSLLILTIPFIKVCSHSIACIDGRSIPTILGCL